MIELKVIGKDGCNDSSYAKELLDDFNKKTEDNIKCTYTIDNSIVCIAVPLGMDMQVQIITSTCNVWKQECDNTSN